MLRSSTYAVNQSGDVFEIAERVRLYTEQVQEHDDIEAIRQTVGEADRLIFRGFGYHRQNIDIITPRQAMSSGVEEIIGTAFGISQPDVEVLEDWLSPLLAEDDTPISPMRRSRK